MSCEDLSYNFYLYIFASSMVDHVMIKPKTINLVLFASLLNPYHKLVESETERRAACLLVGCDIVS